MERSDPTRRVHPRWILLVIAATLLVSCGGDVEMTVDFFSNERWEADVLMTLPKEVSLLAAGVGELEGMLDELARGVEDQGGRVRWKRVDSESDLVYAVEIEGIGLDKLSNIVFDGDARIEVDESTGRRLIKFAYRPGVGLGGSQEFTLRGGEIVSGNGRRVDKQTMSWRNTYSVMEATLTEQTTTNAASVLGIAAGGLAIGALIFGAMQLRQRRPGKSPHVCPACGFLSPNSARFCPGCGREMR
jgi:hypothetical protein